MLKRGQLVKIVNDKSNHPLQQAGKIGVIVDVKNYQNVTLYFVDIQNTNNKKLNFSYLEESLFLL